MDRSISIRAMSSDKRGERQPHGPLLSSLTLLATGLITEIGELPWLIVSISPNVGVESREF